MAEAFAVSKSLFHSRFALAQDSGLVLSLNKEVLMRTHISGSSGAIEKLMSCQEHLIIASKNRLYLTMCMLILIAI